MKVLKDLKLKSLEQLRGLSKTDLEKELENSSKNLYVLKMKAKLGELKQTHYVTALRRYVARVRTIANSK